MAKKKQNPKSKVPGFEESLDALQQIVSQLEEGDLSLSDSLEKYEAGVAHLKTCYRQLQEAQKKIEVLVSLDEHGNVQSRTFDGSATQFDGSGEDPDDDDPEQTQAMDGSDRLF